MPTEIFNRHARPRVLEALADTRVVFISGARHVGKSTLGRGIVNGLPAAEEFSLDRRETRDTVREYVGLLQTVFLVRLLPAWRPGLSARETHAPKAYLVDSGLLAHLLSADEHRTAHDDQVTGKMLENFVVTELLKHADWATTNTRAYHYRQRAEEIDLVMESRTGEIIAVEVKAASPVSRADLRAMEKLRTATGARFKAGVVLCTGPRTTPLGDRLWALPISGLWAHA